MAEPDFQATVATDKRRHRNMEIVREYITLWAIFGERKKLRI